MTPHYHIPVLGREVVAALIQKQTGVYLDATLGGGGHFTAMLENLSASATAIGIDRDRDAIDFVKSHLVNNHGVSVHLQQCAFSAFDTALAACGVTALDGICMDLGVSSHQIDESARGFSYRYDADLDMRMNQQAGQTAADLLNSVSAQDLATILGSYGDITGARTIADALIRFRAARRFSRTGDIAEALTPLFGGRLSYDLLARLYQALRIAVNDELQELSTALEKALAFLKPGGRIAVIAYHSGEDRIVKEFFRQQEKECCCAPEIPRCVCGGKNKKLKRLNRKALKPGQDEIAVNPRSRSARLRIAERAGAAL